MTRWLLSFGYSLLRRRVRPHFAAWSIDPTAKTVLLRVRGGTGCKLSIGAGSIVDATFSFERPGARIVIGTGTFIGRSTLVAAREVQVGNDVLISWDVTIVDHDSHSIRFSERRNDVRDWRDGQKNWEHVSDAPVIIGHKAWIGFGAKILKGVTIGEGAIVGAGAIVTKNVPEWTVVAGNPARVIRELGTHER